MKRQNGPMPESNFILKCILGPKKLFKKKVRSTKILNKKNFGKKIGVKFLDQTAFGSKILRQKKNLGQK